MSQKTLKIALSQIAPVWLNKEATLRKVSEKILEASKENAELIVFGEALVPGYPFWLAYTGGAEWNTSLNKTMHAHYVDNAVCIENGDLSSICELCKGNNIAVYLGIIERPLDRGGKSIYCTLVYIDNKGTIQSVHRKLQPTYDERLTWSPGDGNGLQTHSLKSFTVGGLNCWENWMPLPRAALYAQGEDVHIAVWPGSDHNTKDITRFIARESRSYVISVSALMRIEDIPKDTPHYDLLVEKMPTQMTNGGSCIAGPDGEFEIAPVTNTEGNIYHTIHFEKILQERQNFDPVGHYSRPDVTQLIINSERQSTIKKKES